MEFFIHRWKQAAGQARALIRVSSELGTASQALAGAHNGWGGNLALRRKEVCSFTARWMLLKSSSGRQFLSLCRWINAPQAKSSFQNMRAENSAFTVTSTLPRKVLCKQRWSSSALLAYFSLSLVATGGIPDPLWNPKCFQFPPPLSTHISGCSLSGSRCLKVLFLR